MALPAVVNMRFGVIAKIARIRYNIRRNTTEEISLMILILQKNTPEPAIRQLLAQLSLQNVKGLSLIHI